MLQVLLLTDYDVVLLFDVDEDRNDTKLLRRPLI